MVTTITTIIYIIITNTIKIKNKILHFFSNIEAIINTITYNLNTFLKFFISFSNFFEISQMQNKLIKNNFLFNISNNQSNNFLFD